MTSIDEIYAFVPGEQVSWPVSTSHFGGLVIDLTALAAWRAIQATPDYNAPISWPLGGDYAPLLELFEEAQRFAGPWTADTAAAHAEQQENAWAFRESQLNVIMRQGD